MSQAGRGECRDLIICYYVHPKYVRHICELAPRSTVVYDTQTPTSRYRYTGHGGIYSLESTKQWALTEAGALSFGRIVLVGYSAGCQGVRAILDDNETPDAVVAIDGIHSSSQPTKWQIETWERYFDLAKANKAIMVASCTQITPPKFTSTRKTISLILGYDLPKLKDGDSPVSYRDGQCRVHIYEGRDRKAHSAQAQVHLKTLVSEALDMMLPITVRDVDGSVGERALAYSFGQMDAGVCEIPANSNSGPAIAGYFRPCRRNGKQLGISSGAWCAAAFCAASQAAGAKHEYRASGLELQQDAAANGTWRDKHTVVEGKWLPAPGDGVILKRGSGWQRHVCRFIKQVDADTFQTIGGNEGNRWRVTERSLSSDALLGFIEMPREEHADLSPEDAARFYEISKDVMLGETELVDAMRDVDERDKLS
jgi:hypothetical protein